MNKRHEQILKIISREKETTVSRLSELLNVSVVTVRSDLRFLEDQNLINRSHGRASLPDTDDIAHRLSINYSVKLRIAEKAAEQVNEGETILLESGSSIALMARVLSYRKNINVITNNAFVARQMKDAEDINVILIGGIFQKESETLVGSMVKEYLAYYNFSKVFLGIDGFTINEGVMCRDLDRADIMTEFIKKAEKVYILSDSGKMGVSAVRTVCGPEEIDCVVTDSAIAPEYRDFFEKSDTGLLLV